MLNYLEKCMVDEKVWNQAYFTRLETWDINCDIDSSEATGAGAGSLDDFTSLTSADLAGEVAAAFEDPPTATLEATDGSKSVSRKERKFEKSSSNEND